MRLRAQEMQGRINLMQTDLPHAALWEEDPEPPRAHLLYLSGLPAESRIGDIVPHLERAGLGRARLHFRSSGTQVRGLTEIVLLEACMFALLTAKAPAGAARPRQGLARSQSPLAHGLTAVMHIKLLDGNEAVHCSPGCQLVQLIIPEVHEAWARCLRTSMRCAGAVHSDGRQLPR